MAVPELSDDDKQELRIGLVMNGGVSLAVWMGGVTNEIDCLRRDAGVYGELLNLTQSRAKVDVISGASAGGLNGALLATAIAHGRPLEHVYKLWMNKGAFSELLRSPFSSDIRSLLKGDEFFFPELHDAFKAVARGGQRQARSDLSLTMTTAVPQGMSTGLADDYGNVIPDTTHVGRFSFRGDDWKRGDLPARLALAARSCASFPGAFEASFVPVGERPEPGPARGSSPAVTRPDMRDHVNFSRSRFAVDGGALMNKPFGPALDAIFAQPAGSEVRRVLIYVCPDPGDPEPERAERFDKDQPGMARTVIDSILTMPRTESIAADLNEIREHNDRVSAFRRTRDELLRGSLEESASQLWAAYVIARVESSVERILRSLDTGVYRRTREGASRPGTWNRDLARTVLLKERRRHLPGGPPKSDTPPTGLPAPSGEYQWAWGISPLSTMAMAVLDILTRALAAAPHDEMADEREKLRNARTEVHDIRREIDELTFQDSDFWEGEAGLALEAVAAGRQKTEEWARDAFERWKARVTAASGDPFQRLADLAGELAQIMVNNRETLLAVADEVGNVVEEQDVADEVGDVVEEQDVAEAIRRNTEALAPEQPGDVDGSLRDASLRRLLAVEVAVTVSGSSAPSCDQLVELMMISGFTPNAFDPREVPKAKLAGVQLGHFGAFYKAAWRANDWMFGRLDAAHRLATVLLDPVRLRQLHLEAKDVLEEVKAIASGKGENHEAPADVQRWLDDPDKGALNTEVAEKELKYLETGEEAPRALPECARAVARRLQLEIITSELPRLWTAMKTDDKAGALATSSAPFRVKYEEEVPRWFQKQYERALKEEREPELQPLPPTLAVDLFRSCNIGSERVLQDAGSALFTSTVTTAAAVGVQAGQSVRSGLGPFRFVFSVLRTFVFALYFLAASAIRATKPTFALTTLLLAFGAVLVTLSLVDVDAVPQGLVLVGWLLVAAGLVLAWFRSGTPVGALVLVLATAAAFAWPYVFIGAPDEPGEEWRRTVRPALAAFGLVFAPLATGAIIRRVRPWWQRKAIVPRFRSWLMARTIKRHRTAEG